MLFFRINCFIMPTVIVTGASSGIGRSIALQLAKMHYSLVVTGRDNKKMTGLRPTTTGVYALRPWIREVEGYEDVVTLPQYFEKYGYITMATGKNYHDAYPPEEFPYEWNNLARHEGYEPVMEKLAGHLPESAPPAPGSKTRLIELIDRKPYWQGEKIPQDARVPMEWLR